MTDIYPSFSSHAVLSDYSRRKKADKIIEIVNTEIDLTNSDVLDVGIGSGHITHYLSRISKSVTGVNISDEREISTGYNYVEVSGAKLPFSDNSFDVVVSNQVIEHMTCQNEHISEIYRVLKPSGVLYLAMPNKYSLIEPHFKFPFLSWLPRSVANKITTSFYSQVWDVYPLDYFTARSMVDDHFSFTDKTIEVIRNPEKFKLDVAVWAHFILQRTPERIFKLLYPLIPAYIWILRPKK